MDVGVGGTNAFGIPGIPGIIILGIMGAVAIWKPYTRFKMGM
jgi:hypothetical protein